MKSQKKKVFETIENAAKQKGWNLGRQFDDISFYWESKSTTIEFAIMDNEVFMSFNIVKMKHTEIKLRSACLINIEDITIKRIIDLVENLRSVVMPGYLAMIEADAQLKMRNKK